MRRIISAAVAAALLLALCLAASAVNNSLNNFTRKSAYPEDKFTDVPEAAWFFGSVKTAYELGLCNGVSNTEFRPDGDLTLAETVALAARIHSIYSVGTAYFRQLSPWYQVYVDYCVQNGVIDAGEFTDYGAKATRAQFASVMARSLPQSALPPINRVRSLPDVAESAPYAAAVLTLYEAGVLTGSDDYGAFLPDAHIRRSEVAAIVSRMASAALRSRFVLLRGGAEANSVVFSPEDGETLVSLSSDLIVRFPEPVTLADGSEMISTSLRKAFSLAREGSAVTVPLTARINDAHTVISVQLLNRLRGLSQYQLDVRAGAFRGESGRLYGGNAIRFSTRAEDDTVVVTPVAGSGNVSINAVPTFQFNNALTAADGGELTAAYLAEHLVFRLQSADGRDIPFTASYNPAAFTIRIAPTAPLWDYTRYYVEIPAGALRSPHGLMQAYTTFFTTSPVVSASNSTFSTVRAWLRTLEPTVAGKSVNLHFQPGTTYYTLQAHDGDTVTLYATPGSVADVLIAAYRDTTERIEVQPPTVGNTYSFTFHPDDPASPMHLVLIARPKSGSENLQIRYVVDLQQSRN